MVTEFPPTASASGIRAALAHLHDPAYLETHPLGTLRGRALRRALEDAIETLRPDRQADPRTRRIHQLLRLRYLEVLPVADVMERLSVGRSEYYREHERAIAALEAIVAPHAGAGTRPEPTASPARERLPVQLTSFVGRSRELGDLRNLLERARLLTLVGPGGAGKTRLALELAARVGPGYTDGVCFVDLTPFTDGDRIGPANHPPSSLSNTSPDAACCWSSTTASTSSPGSPTSSTQCCAAVRSCASSRPAANR